MPNLQPKWVREGAIPLPPSCRTGVDSPDLPACPFRAPGDAMSLAPCGEDTRSPTPEQAAARSRNKDPGDGNRPAETARCRCGVCACTSYTGDACVSSGP